MSLVTVYANVRVTMNHAAARRALATVLRAAHRRTRQEPDVIGLGEWGRGRGSVLRSFGSYRWCRPLRGGGPLGLHRGRFERIRCRAVKLVGRSRVEPDPGNPRRHLGPSWATVVTAVEKRSRQDRAWVLYHFTAGVQDGHGHYKDQTHPLRCARHRAERAGVEHEATQLEADGYEVTLLGDGNFDGLTFSGFISADPPPDLGDRAVSDVFAREPAEESSAVADGSDHSALIVVR